MRRILPLLLALALPALAGEPGQALVLRNAPVALYFSPNGGAMEAIVEAIQTARKTVKVQAYSFTAAPIAKALTDAAERGVQVQVVVDHSQLTERYSVIDFLQRRGVLVLVDSAHAIAHSKVIVIDGEVVITGSYNFSKSAEERNLENLLVIRDRTLAAPYMANWALHARHSEEPVVRDR